MSNKVIGIEYTLKDAKTGEQLDTNVGQAPLEFISGKGQIIPGLESKLVEMSANEEADVLVQPVDAYMVNITMKLYKLYQKSNLLVLN